MEFLTWLLVLSFVGANGQSTVTSQMVTEAQCRAALMEVAPVKALAYSDKSFCVSPEGVVIVSTPADGSQNEESAPEKKKQKKEEAL
jgi:hypothetical protein